MTQSGGSAFVVDGIRFDWELEAGELRRDGYATTALFRDSSLMSLLRGFHAMVGTERFALAQQAEGRRSTDEDWQVISAATSFEAGFSKMAISARVAGWGRWVLHEVDRERKRLVVHVYNSWEGCVQRAAGVEWGSNLIAGKFADFASRLFDTNCWSEQTRAIARGDAYDEFVASPSSRTLEDEVRRVTEGDAATRHDLARALAERSRLTEELQRQLGVISQQRTEIAALSAPVLHLWSGVLAIPLNGALDQGRMHELSARVLDAVSEHEAHTVLLDVTGLDDLDGESAGHLLRVVAALRLLGTRVFVTGVRPDMARSIVSLDVDLADVRTFSTLQQALEHVLAGDDAL